jgi:hypothetical protein
MNTTADAPLDVPKDAARADGEQRVAPDRRSEPTSVWGSFPLAGQRMRNRRAEEHQQQYFVDRFSSAMLLLILMLVGASLLDAVLTIRLIEAGGREVNPLMDRVLNQGLMPFLMVKYLLTVLGLPILLIFKNFYLFGTQFRVGHLIPAILVLYAMLVAYQLALMYMHVGLY